MQFKCRFNSHSQLFLYKGPLVRKARVASQFYCLAALFSSFTPSCPELSPVISCHRVQSEGLIFLKTLPLVLESSPLWHSGVRGESRVPFLSKHRCDRWLSPSEASQWTIIKELWSTVAKESFSQETFFSQFLPWSEMNLYTQRKKKSTRYINIFMLPVIRAKDFFSCGMDKDTFFYCLRPNWLNKNDWRKWTYKGNDFSLLTCMWFHLKF